MIKKFEYSDKGPRAINEDYFRIIENSDYISACLGDGVGGEKCGKLASTSTVDFFLNKIISFDTDLVNVVTEAHQNIKTLQKNNKDCFGMATTLTGCLLNHNILKGVHVGDSRLCILRGNGIKQLTENHTEVQRLVKSGKIKFEDIETYPRKNILESAIGINGELMIQSFEFTLENNDRILLTSDGVHDVISKIEFRDLSKKHLNLVQFGDSIIQLLKYKKLKDNVSFIILELEN